MKTFKEFTEINETESDDIRIKFSKKIEDLLAEIAKFKHITDRDAAMYLHDILAMKYGFGNFR